MKFRFLTNVKYQDKYWEAGEEIELTDGGDLLEEGMIEGVEKEEKAEEAEKVDLSKKKATELRAMAKGNGIDTEGMKKLDLIEALEK